MKHSNDDGIGLGVKTTPSYQATWKAQDDCKQLLCSTDSPTFFSATSTTRPTKITELPSLVETASVYSSADASSRIHSFVVPLKSCSSLTNEHTSPEALYTLVTLEGNCLSKKPTDKPNALLLDLESPTTQNELEHFFQPTTEALIGKTTASAKSAGKSASGGPQRKKNPTTMRDNMLYRMQRILLLYRKPMVNCMLPICLLTGLVLLIYTFRETAKGILFWIESQNSWIIFVIFLCMFIIVSFPVTVGYLVLIIASGYLFGFFRGLATVMIGANLGVTVAHNTIKSLHAKLPIHKLIKNETSRAILRVISGPKAFKIVLFARLTPIPFGLQNTIFGISSVNSRSYHAGTIIGLLPAQTINVYLGSKLRSIHEVLNDHNAALGLAGYGVFVVEVIVGAALMVWVIQKARLELSAALLATAEADSDEKILIEIEA